VSDDLAKLKATLRRAAADGVSGSTRLAIADPQDGAARILDAVDATLLPRRISVEVEGRDAALLLEAAGRRLQRLSEPLPPGFALSAGEELKAADAEAMATGLLGFCDGKAALHISSKPITDAGDPSEGGIPPDLVRAQLGLADRPAPFELEAELNMEPFIAALGAKCLAALWIQDEDVSLLAGPETRAAALSNWAAPMLEQLLAPEFPLSAGLETDGIVVFALPESKGLHAVIAGRLGAYFVAEIDGADPSETLKAWQAAHS